MWSTGQIVRTTIWFLSSMAPGAAIGGISFLILFHSRKRRLAGLGLCSGPLREITMLLFWMYAGGMAAITLFSEPSWLLSGLRGDWPPLFDLSGIRYRMNLIPFSKLDNFYNIIGNIVMFVPFGFFAPLLWRGFTWKRGLALGFVFNLNFRNYV